MLIVSRGGSRRLLGVGTEKLCSASGPISGGNVSLSLRNTKTDDWRSKLPRSPAANRSTIGQEGGFSKLHVENESVSGAVQLDGEYSKGMAKLPPQPDKTILECPRTRQGPFPFAPEMDSKSLIPNGQSEFSCHT